jgi:arylformamidase
MDLNAQYNNRALVPDHADVIDGWQRDAEGFRQQANGSLACKLWRA